MPHVQKFTQAKIGFVLSHNFRSKNTVFKSVDTDLSDLNEYFVNTGDGLERMSYVDNKAMYEQALRYEKRLLNETPHVNKSDLVTTASWVVTCPKSLSRDEQQKFLYGSIQFVSERYGERNIISASIHNDEPGAMPHVHIVFMPVDKRGRICAKQVLTRRDLQTWHPDLEKYTSVVLGHEVKVMLDDDEKHPYRSMSQFKADTKMKNAEKLLQNAYREAEELAKGNLSKLGRKGFLGRFRDNSSLVREAIKNASTAEALAKTKIEHQSMKFEKDRESFRRQSDVLMHREMELEDDRNQFRLEQQRVADEQEEMAKELEDKRLANERREKALNERLAEVRRLADQSARDKAEAQKIRAEAKAKEEKLQDDRKQFDMEKVAYQTWKKTWQREEQANRSRDIWLQKYKTCQKAYEDSWDKINDLRKENADLKEQMKIQIMDSKAQIIDSDKKHRTEIDAVRNEEKKKLSELTKEYDDKLAEKNKIIAKARDKITNTLKEMADINEERWDYVEKNRTLEDKIKGLETTLVNQKTTLNCSMSENVALRSILDNKTLNNGEKAVIKAYHEQTTNAFEKAGQKASYTPQKPTERIQEIKEELDRPKGIHRSNSVSRGRSR